jgi:hypothetical protein
MNDVFIGAQADPVTKVSRRFGFGIVRLGDRNGVRCMDLAHTQDAYQDARRSYSYL